MNAEFVYCFDKLTLRITTGNAVEDAELKKLLLPLGFMRSPATIAKPFVFDLPAAGPESNNPCSGCNCEGECSNRPVQPTKDETQS